MSKISTRSDGARSNHYPLCNKHKWIARFYGFGPNQAWPTGFVMALAFPFLLCPPIIFATKVGSQYSDPILVIAYVLFGARIIYLKMQNPVKIVKAKKNQATVRVANKDYAEQFRQANAA